MSGGKNKHKKRTVTPTALVYCEGAHDLAFVRHVINVYAQAGMTGTRFRSKQGKGGAPDMLLIEASNVLGSFDRRLVKADNDRAALEVKKAEALALKNGISIIWSKPCIEGLLLAILEGKDFSGYKSKTCKRTFEAKYIPAGKRTDSRSYAKLFTLQKLEEARKRIPELDQLISFIIS